MKFIINLISDIVIIALGTILIYKSWYWFLLPVFPSCTHINYAQALGLLMILTLFNSTSAMAMSWQMDKDNEDEMIKYEIIKPILLAFSLLVFYIVHLCIS
jgi:hypothetical protein